jgi:hypothetical protein
VVGFTYTGQTVQQKRHDEELREKLLNERKKEKEQTLKILLNHGAHYSSLHGPAAIGDLAMMKKMFKKGADPNQVDRTDDEYYPMYFAHNNNQTEAIKLLNKMGAGPKMQNQITAYPRRRPNYHF